MIVQCVIIFRLFCKTECMDLEILVHIFQYQIYRVEKPYHHHTTAMNFRPHYKQFYRY